MILFKVLHTKLTMTDTNRFSYLLNDQKLKNLHVCDGKDSSFLPLLQAFSRF